MSDQPDETWEAATWEGSRRAQIRRSLRLTPRERLEAMVELTETAGHLARARRISDRGKADASAVAEPECTYGDD